VAFGERSAAEVEVWAREQDGRDRLARTLGIELLEARPGHARLAMTVSESILNAHGMCHGGAIFSLADAGFFYACNSGGVQSVAAGCDINYLRPAKLGERLEVVVRERSRSRRSGLYDAEVRNGEGQLVAVMSGRAMAVPSTG
jgi:acyl-CoA thioesterase